MSTSVDKIMQQANQLSPAEMEELHTRLDEALSLKRGAKTYEEVERELIGRGIITPASNPSAISKFAPVAVKGKPVSETIIEERR